MKALLKYGGLTFSGALTLSLFVRLFGAGAYGLTMALAALALFEMGAAGWSHLLKTARDGQRQIARVCLSLTVALSLLSSLAEIVMATQLGADSLALLDLPFITLLMIGLALSANVIGAIAFEYAAPELASKLRELDRQGKAQKAKQEYQDKVFDMALVKTEQKIDDQSNELADWIAEGFSGEIKTKLRALRTLSAPVGETRRELPAPEPAPTRRAASPVMGGDESGKLPALTKPLPAKTSRNSNGKHAEAAAPKA